MNNTQSKHAFSPIIIIVTTRKDYEHIERIVHIQMFVVRKEIVHAADHEQDLDNEINQNPELQSEGT